MPDVIASLEQHAAFNTELLRKPLNGTAFLALHALSDPITSIVSPNGLVKLPDTHESAGRLSDDGIQFSTDVKMTELRGFGSNSVLRRDIQQRDITAEFAFLESKRLAYEVQTGLNLRSKTMSAGGEWYFDYPSRPQTLYWRCLFLAKDGEGDSLFYMARYFPRCTLADKAKEVWRDKEEGLMRAVTLGADEDSEVGTGCREFLFGPGALAAAESMGIEVETAPTLAAPTGLTTGAVTGTSVALTWSSVTNATGYQVMKSIDGGDSYTSVGSGNGGTPTGASTTVTGLTAATAHRFRVKATASGTEGPLSASVAATTS